MKKIKEHSGLLIVLSIALALRVVYLILYSQLPEWSILTVDNYYHHNLALAIANGNLLGDTTYFRAPFYIYTLAMLYKLFGFSLWVGRIFGLLIGLATVVTTYKIADLIFNKRVALFASILVCFYPAIIYFESELLLDAYFMLLLELAVYFFLKHFKQSDKKSILLSAIFLGLSIITRPTALIVLPVFALIVLFKKNEIGRKLKYLFLFLAPLIIIIAPVTIRNIVVADDPVLIASQGGINFYIGNNETADGISAIMPEPMGYNWRISQITHIAEQEWHHKLKPGEVSSFWYQKGLDWIMENPIDFAKLYLIKVYHNLNDREISNNRNLDSFYQKIPLLKYNPLSFGILFIFSLFGVLFFFAKNKSIQILTVIILFYVLASSLFFFNSRFRLPLLPFYIVMTAGTIVLMVENYKKLKKKLVLIIPLLLFFGLFSFYPAVKLKSGSQVLDYTAAGNYFFSLKEYWQAGEFYKKAHTADSTFAEVNLNLGNFYLMSGIEDSALYYFKQELYYFPGRYKALTNLASIEYLNNNLSEANHLIDSALKLGPFDLTANLLKYRILFADSSSSADKRYRVVTEGFENCQYQTDLLTESVLLFADKKEFHYIDMILDTYKGNKHHPIETNDELFSKSFTDTFFSKNKRLSRMYYQLGFLEGINGLIDQSISHSRKAIYYDSTLIEAYINLINGYLSNRSLDQAKEIYETANKLFPNHPYLLKIKPALR